MPANYGKKALSYKLTLSATGAEGTGKAKITVSVQNASPLATGITGAGDDSCAVLKNEHIKCWGVDAEGQLGNGKKSEDQDVPVEAKNITTATQVTAEGDATCALLSTGHVKCWGGSVGYTPVEIKSITSAVEVTDGGGASCALLSNGHIECWGVNEAGELGNGTHVEFTEQTPSEVLDITDAIQITGGKAVNDGHVCALLSTGRVDCWGDNDYGQLGQGTSEGPESCLFESHACSVTPLEVPGVTGAVRIGAGPADTCAVLSDGHVQCWGRYIKRFEKVSYPQNSPAEVPSITDATSVTSTQQGPCAVLSTGHVECWGFDEDGDLGNGEAGSGAFQETPVEVSGLEDATQVASGEEHTCALLATGDVRCWGSNSGDALGDGEEHGLPKDVPVEVVGL
jgi:alpha-tubulin suppressor-like RCC1 family protein